MKKEPRTALVVGASKGIGRALALALARRGADVAVMARGPAALALCEAELEAAVTTKGQRVLSRALDARDPDATREALAWARRELGPFDLVASCAGSCRPASFESIDVRAAREAFDSNFFATWNVCQAALAHLAPGGVLLPTASVAGHIGLFGYTAYAASKFAVIGFAESLRSELAGRGQRISVLCPPDTDTPGFEEERRLRPPETEAICGNAGLLEAVLIAEYTLSRLRHDDFIIMPGRMARLTWWVKRVFPGLVYAQMDATVRRARALGA